MLKTSLLSPSVPCLSALYVCVCASVCVRASCRFEKSTSKPRPPRASEHEKEDAAKMFSTKRSAQCHFWSILIQSNKKKKKEARQESQGILKWLLLIMADISGQLCSTDDFGCEKTLMWRKVMVDFRSQRKKNIPLLLFVYCKVCKLYYLSLHIYTLELIFSATMFG